MKEKYRLKTRRKVLSPMQTMLDNLPFDVWFKDPDGRYLCVNEHFTKYAGKPKPQIRGRTDYDLYPAEEAEIYVNSDQAALSGLHPGFYESQYRPGLFKEEFKAPAYDSEGRLAGTTGYSRDITEQVRVSRALRKSEQRFRTIFEEAPLGVGVFDSHTGQAVMVNAKFLEIVGHSRDEIDTLPWQAYSHPDEIQENLDNMALLVENRIGSFCMDKRFIRSDGSIVWAHMTIAPISDPEDGVADPAWDRLDPHQHLCMLVDVTEQKKREQEILYLSYRDALTGLYNRAFYNEEKSRLDTERQLPFSIILGDVNGLKLTNDMFGHEAGDQLLNDMSDILRRCCRAEDIVARIGGDEFAILLPATDAATARGITQRIYEECRSGAAGAEGARFLRPSIALGCAAKTSPSQRIEAIEKEAEEIMYRRKLIERNNTRQTLISSIRSVMLEKTPDSWENAERRIALIRAIAGRLGLPARETEPLELLAVLYDVGEIHLPREVLFKESPLDASEWSLVHNHPEAGYRIAQAVPELQPIADAIYSHHENWDGKGYPRGLAGEAIPLAARILALVDAYDAMTSDRPYRKALSRTEALDAIRAGAGSRFDPLLADLFLETAAHPPV